MRLPRRELLGSLAVGSVISANPVQAQEAAPKAPPLPSFSGQRVLVLGGTGRTGGFAVARLLAAGAKVRGAARDVAKAKAQRPEVEWVKADVKDLRSLKGLAKGCDRVLCAIGANTEADPSNAPELVEFKGIAALADEAKAAGVKHFVLLSANAVGGDLSANTAFATLMRFKKQGEDALTASGVPYTILRPTALWDQPGGQHGIALLSRGLAVNAVMCREDVAAVMVQALSTANAAGKTIHCFNVVARDPHAWMKDFPKLAI